MMLLKNSKIYKPFDIQKMKINNIGILILLIVVFFSCKKKKNVIAEDFINLNPNKSIIKKQYNRYSTFNSFFPENSLFTPIISKKKYH